MVNKNQKFRAVLDSFFKLRNRLQEIYDHMRNVWAISYFKFVKSRLYQSELKSLFQKKKKYYKIKSGTHWEQLVKSKEKLFINWFSSPHSKLYFRHTREFLMNPWRPHHWIQLHESVIDRANVVIVCFSSITCDTISTWFRFTMKRETARCPRGKLMASELILKKFDFTNVKYEVTNVCHDNWPYANVNRWHFECRRRKDIPYDGSLLSQHVKAIFAEK